MNSCSCVVSIHLMFLLIELCRVILLLLIGFNTSHVSINPGVSVYYHLDSAGFNTSHVSINRQGIDSGK